MKKVSITTILVAVLLAVGLVILYFTYGRKEKIPPQIIAEKYVRLHQPIEVYIL